MKTAIILDPAFEKHEMGDFAPECPARLKAISDHLQETRLLDELREITLRRYAEESEVTLVHTPSHWNDLLQSKPEFGYARIDADTKMNASTFDTSRLATGAVLDSVDQILNGSEESIFCSVRPPGHHAQSNLAMGFCFFNHVAIGAAYALRTKEISRVLIVDFDVHHGNGTEEIFATDPRVMILSSFQHPFYPGVPFLRDHDRIINSPFPAHSKDDRLQEVVHKIWIPKIYEFKPELVFFSAGFDAHEADPLGGLNWQTQTYGWLAYELMSACKSVGVRGAISSLEGGYEPRALALSVAAYLRGFLAL